MYKPKKTVLFFYYWSLNFSDNIDNKNYHFLSNYDLTKYCAKCAYVYYLI